MNPEQRVLFAAGDGGYHTYRIPALVVSRSGTLLAFCEGRRFSSSDAGQIDLLLRRSADGGRTFNEQQIIASEPGWTCGNPAPVVDRQTGAIWLLFSKNAQDATEARIWQGEASRTVWVTRSDDDGATWSAPAEITAQVKPENWSWYATGPGHGLQQRSRRLLIACDHGTLQGRGRQDPHHSHVIYSDDQGSTWQLGGSVDEGTNESTAMETADGWLYINCRNRLPLTDGRNFRAVAWSRDGGESFSPLVHDAALPEPICQASVYRCPDALPSGATLTIFSNPAATDPICGGRNHLTLRLSFDEGRTWPMAHVLWPGPAAYSDLSSTPDGAVFCLYENGDAQPYERITLARLGLDELVGDTPGRSAP
jgi:sialidase-1